MEEALFLGRPQFFSPKGGHKRGGFKKDMGEGIGYSLHKKKFGVWDKNMYCCHMMIFF